MAPTPAETPQPPKEEQQPTAAVVDAGKRKRGRVRDLDGGTVAGIGWVTVVGIDWVTVVDIDWVIVVGVVLIRVPCVESASIRIR